MGSQYVNDFDFNNRSYRVMVQADQQFRSQPRDLRQFYVRSDDGHMVSLDNLVTVKEGTNASIINHYNLFRSVEIDGSAAQDTAPARPSRPWNKLPKKLCPGLLLPVDRHLAGRDTVRLAVADALWAGVAGSLSHALRAV